MLYNMVLLPVASTCSGNYWQDNLNIVSMVFAVL